MTMFALFLGFLGCASFGFGIGYQVGRMSRGVPTTTTRTLVDMAIMEGRNVTIWGSSETVHDGNGIPVTGGGILIDSELVAGEPEPDGNV